MPPPNFSPGQINQVSESVAEYIASQRDRFREHATNLPPAQKSALTGFFRPDLLEATRILVLETERIANPPFYLALRSTGFTNLPDFAFMAAVTFGDTIVSHQPFSSGLLFHEFVHAEQYRQLGIPRFAGLYVRGFLAGRSYDGIPLKSTPTPRRPFRVCTPRPLFRRVRSLLLDQTRQILAPGSGGWSVNKESARLARVLPAGFCAWSVDARPYSAAFCSLPSGPLFLLTLPAACS